MNVDLKESFPLFNNLPDYYEPFSDYYCFNSSGQGDALIPVRHWCFMAEIKTVMQFPRPHVLCSPVAGEELVVSFYHDHNDNPVSFKWTDLQPGRTIAIMYAKRKQMMDGSVGIRQEDLKNVYIFKAPLKTIQITIHTLISPKLKCFLSKCSRRAQTPSEEQLESLPLKRCGGCHLVYYCGAGHQKESWLDQSHNKMCKEMKFMRNLLGIMADGGDFDGQYFPFTKIISM